MPLLTVIPARGGSKGIPGKNKRLLGGKPLIQWTIEAAKAASTIGRIIVTTDDPDIVDIAETLGIAVPVLRPASLAADDTPTVAVLLYELDTLEYAGEFFDSICVLQPTSPFRTHGHIDAAIRLFREHEYDSLISVLPVPLEYNPHWVFEDDMDGNLRISTGDTSIIPRRQELPRAWHRDGSVYVTRVSVLRSTHSLVSGRLGKIVADQSTAVNLDDEDDWLRAESIAASLNGAA